MKNDMRAPASVPTPAGKRTKAEKLARAAQAAADVRAYDTNPDVIAYRIERMRARVDWLIWTGLILGLAFTMANVQNFAAADETPFTILWWIAWLLDPMVSLVLVGVLLGEQVIARHEVVAGRWVRRTKWTALLLTYGMNTWQAWTALDPAAILLHSVPPAMVFCAAEAVTTLRLQITEAVRKAYDAAAVQDRTEEEPARRTARTYVFRTAPRTEEPRTIRRAFTFRSGGRTEEPRTARRTFVFRTGPAAAPVRTIRRAFAFLPATRTERQPVRRPARTETPVLADREEFVAEITQEILAAAERGDRWGPDYEVLMARTGRRRSWCEKAVRAARTNVFRTETAVAA
ncbi:hypothetical protein [Streptosporangium sp. NPDC087985]|uniref:hypothetical protein n=1 Tax=Streptosporangium sp. NPDC087985 TaxID=3366196 RepID=UPI0038030062